MKNLFLAFTAFAITITGFNQVRLTPVKSAGERLNEEYCSGLFKTPDANYFDFADNINNASAMGYINVLDWLQGRVAGLQVYKYWGNISIPYIRNQRAAVYIDEIPVSPDWASVVPVADIGMIKVIKGPFIGAASQYGNGGAILIYTKHGENEEES